MTGKRPSASGYDRAEKKIKGMDSLLARHGVKLQQADRSTEDRSVKLALSEHTSPGKSPVLPPEGATGGNFFKKVGPLKGTTEPMNGNSQWKEGPAVGTAESAGRGRTQLGWLANRASFRAAVGRASSG